MFLLQVSNKKVVQHVILWYTFTGKSYDTIIKKGKTTLTDAWNNLLRQIITSETKNIDCDKNLV